MRGLNDVLHKMKKLDFEFSAFKKMNFSKIDISKDDWIDKVKSELALFNNTFKLSISTLNNNLVSNLNLYTKDDILKIQNEIKKTIEISNSLGFEIEMVKHSRRIKEALFLLLLKSTQSDYRDCLMELKELLEVAKNTEIDYKKILMELNPLFERSPFIEYCGNIV